MWLVSGHRGPGDSSLGMGVRLSLWADGACRFPLRLLRARSDRGCEGGRDQFGQQSGWGGTPARGLVSVSMPSCRWECPWPQESLQVRGTAWGGVGSWLLQAPWVPSEGRRCQAFLAPILGSPGPSVLCPSLVSHHRLQQLEEVPKNHGSLC